MPQSPLAAYVARLGSSFSALSLGKAGELIEAAAHGQYYEGTYAGRTFGAANQSGVTTSAALATTYTGLCVSNPAGSGKNLAIGRVSGMLIVAPAAQTGLYLIGGYSAAGIVTHTTPLTPFSQFLNGVATPVGLADAACTLVGTPTVLKPLAAEPTATGYVSFLYDVAGGIIVPPGGYVAIGTTIAGPAAGFLGSIEWEENAQ